jgi:hypothetical protein
MRNVKVFWIFVIIGFAIIIFSFYMRRSPDAALHGKATIVGWSGVLVVLIGRIFFARKSKPKDVKDLFPPKKQE